MTANLNPVIMPCRNNLDMTKKAVKTVLSQDIPVNLLIIDNESTDGMSEYFRTVDTVGYVYFNPPKSVAASWNYGLKFFFDIGYEHVLVVNNDIELRPDNYRRLLADGGGFVTGVGVREWPPDGPPSFERRPHPDFSNYLIRRDTYYKVGPFDENFLCAFGEDWDYHVRMHLAGVNAHCIDLPFLHHGSMTIKNATPSEIRKIQQQADKNRAYFKKKWGMAGASEEYYKFFGNQAPDLINETSR